MSLDQPIAPVWFDTVGAAQYLGSPTETLLHWRKVGRGPRFHKIGRRVRYSAADLNAFLESCAVGDGKVA